MNDHTRLFVSLAWLDRDLDNFILRKLDGAQGRAE